MHPARAPQRVAVPEPIVCPACSREFVSSKHVAAWPSMLMHLTDSQDAAHEVWRTDNPAGVRCDYEEDYTLVHALRGWPNFFQTANGTPAAAIDATDATGVTDAMPESMSTSAAKEPSEAATVHLVHRLDCDTSGLVCVAATAAMARALQAAWPTFSKTYLVLVRGRTEASFTVNRPLSDYSTKCKVAPQREATTSFEVARRCGWTEGVSHFTLLRATLVRGGRTHQIRRHLGSVAHQVVGDKKYGKSGINEWLCRDFGLGRIFLHAARLQGTHPVTGATIDVEDPLPRDLAEFLERFDPV